MGQRPHDDRPRYGHGDHEPKRKHDAKVQLLGPNEQRLQVGVDGLQPDEPLIRKRAFIWPLAKETPLSFFLTSMS